MTSIRQQLLSLEATERKAWRVLMKGTEADACTMFGQEGKNHLAWSATADACGDFRKAHDLVGVPTRMVRG